MMVSRSRIANVTHIGITSSIVSITSVTRPSALSAMESSAAPSWVIWLSQRASRPSMPSDTAAARNSQQAASQRSFRISHPTTGTAARRRRVMTFGTLKTRSLMVLPYLIQGLPGKLVPQLVESFHRHRIRRLQFLGEQRNPQLLQLPAKIVQCRRHLSLHLAAPRQVLVLQGQHASHAACVALLGGRQFLQPLEDAVQVTREILQVRPRRGGDEVRRYQRGEMCLLVAHHGGELRLGMESRRHLRMEVENSRDVAQQRLLHHGNLRFGAFLLLVEFLLAPWRVVVTQERACGDRVE